MTDKTTDTYPCVRCHTRLPTKTQRTMHVIRQRCPEINSRREADAVAVIHGLDATARSLQGHARADELYRAAYDREEEIQP